MTDSKHVVVAVSGGFDPPTAGHIEYFYKAKKLGDWLIVILNTDEFLLDKRKGTKLEGRIRYPLRDRIKIISAFKPVDRVVVSIDKDQTVAETLRTIKPDIFANGGDRNESNASQKEIDVCKEIGCKVVYGCGEKISSSFQYNWEDY